MKEKKRGWIGKGEKEEAKKKATLLREDGGAWNRMVIFLFFLCLLRLSI